MKRAKPFIFRNFLMTGPKALFHPLTHSVALGSNYRQIVPRVGMIGLNLQRQLVLLNRGIEPPRGRQAVAKVVMELGDTRLDRQCLLEVVGGGVDTARARIVARLLWAAA